MIFALWCVYDPANPGFSDLLTIDAGIGYWIYMTQVDTLTVTGITPSKTVSLLSGWNLIGYNSSALQSITSALNFINGKYISVWSFENGSWKVYDPVNPGFSDIHLPILSQSVCGYPCSDSSI